MNGIFKKIYYSQDIRAIIVLVLILAVFGTLVWFIIPAGNIQKRDMPKNEIPVAQSLSPIYHGDRTKEQVIFTFDGGSVDVSGRQILPVLAKHHVKGTFFLTGKFMEQNADLVKQMIAAGYEVYSHTYDHPYLTRISDIEIADELKKADMTFKDITGGTLRPYYRPPYGDIDKRVIETAYEYGYEAVLWSVDAEDWEAPNISDEEVVNKIISNIRPGNIFLMHIGDDITGRVLDRVFSEIEAKGYKIVSLREGLEN